MNKNKAVYINVGDSTHGVRKDILNLNIDLINLLKKYEYLKEIRHNKQKGFNILKELIKEINTDFLKLKNDLPEVPQRKEEKVKLKVEENRFNVKRKKVNKELTSLDKEMNKLKLKLRDIR